MTARKQRTERIMFRWLFNKSPAKVLAVRERPFPRPSRTGSKVRIIKTPSGRAPEWVRQAWVGLVLPERYVGDGDRAINGMFGRGGGTLEFPDSSIYVLYEKGLEILADKSPDAAKWWRENAWADQSNTELCLNFKRDEIDYVV